MTVGCLACLALAASACNKNNQGASAADAPQQSAAGGAEAKSVRPVEDRGTTAPSGGDRATEADSADPCRLLTRSEAATVIDDPGPPKPGDLGISKECKYSHDTDDLDLFVDVLPNDKAKMETFRGVYDPKDITQLSDVGDVAFEFFQNPGEIRDQRRSIVVLKGSTRFTLNLYRKTGELGEVLNDKLVALAKAVAGRL